VGTGRSEGRLNHFTIIQKGTGMRNAVVQLVLVIIGISSIHAARLLATSSIHLRMDPVGSADKVQAIQGHDTLEMSRMNGVYFVRWINPGRWQVLVKASAPYKDSRYDLTVGPGGDLDLGEIQLLR
jgi:hypothetical protein